MAQLIHLVYASVATHPFSPEELGALLDQSRAANERAGLTGMLLYADGSFFQVLEGEPASVEAVATRIRVDPRHANMIVIIREPIVHRSFGDWSMGFSQVSSSDIAELVGRNDFFEEGSCLARLNSGRAQKLLTAFARGRWRAQLAGSLPVAG